MEYILDAIGDDLEPEEVGPPTMRMLETDAAYVLDCHAEMYVWYGERAERTVRLGALKVAHQLLRSVPRPKWANQAVHTRQQQEPFLFRVKFVDWGAMVRPRAASRPETFFRAVRTIAAAPTADGEAAAVDRLTAALRAAAVVPPPTAEDKLVVEAGAGGDDGYGELLVWRVTKKGLVAIADSELGQLQSASSYVMLYGYDAADPPSAAAEEARAAAAVASGKVREPRRQSSEEDDDEEEDDEEEKEEEEDDEESQEHREAGAVRPRFLMYFWQGARAKKSDWVVWRLELRAKMVQQWETMIGAAVPSVRVEQGREPRHFRLMFAAGRGHGRLTVHDRHWRKRDNPERRVCLFKARDMGFGGQQVFQVPPFVSALSSTDVFVCIRTVVTDGGYGDDADESVWFWIGRHAPLQLQEFGSKALMALMEYYRMPSDFPVHILEEAELYEDAAAHWEEMADSLGGEAGWASFDGAFPDDIDPDDDLAGAGPPQLLLADARSGWLELAAAPGVQQEALGPKAVAVLDAPEGVYVWSGALADRAAAALVQRAAAAYCRGKPLPCGRRVTAVRAGHEPLEFRSRFQTWDDSAGGGGIGGGNNRGGAPAFQDVYEQRLTRMAAEGRLGDMAALRGRVMNDAEASQWREHSGVPAASSTRVWRGRGTGGDAASAQKAGLPPGKPPLLSIPSASGGGGQLAAGTGTGGGGGRRRSPGRGGSPGVRHGREPSICSNQSTTSVVGSSLLQGALDKVARDSDRKSASPRGAPGHRRGQSSTASVARLRLSAGGPGSPGSPDGGGRGRRGGGGDQQHLGGPPDVYLRALAALHGDTDAAGERLDSELRAAGSSALRMAPSPVGSGTSPASAEAAAARLPAVEMWGLAHFPHAHAAAATAAATAAAAATATAATDKPVSLREAMALAKLQVDVGNASAQPSAGGRDGDGSGGDHDDDDSSRRRARAADARWRQPGIMGVVLAEFAARFIGIRKQSEDSLPCAATAGTTADGDKCGSDGEKRGLDAVVQYQEDLLKQSASHTGHGTATGA
ncbi:unnamed protein product [Phaeothamnion confervicola]